MASGGGPFINTERSKKASKLLDLRHKIANRMVKRLRKCEIGIIGDEGTGRHTLLRRFLNLNDPPFRHRENRRHDSPCEFVVDLKAMPNVLGWEEVFVVASIFNFQQLDFDTIFQTIAKLGSFVVIFDVGNLPTLPIAIRCMVKITTVLGSSAPRFVLAGNKIDLPQREVSKEIGLRVAEDCKAERYYECSSLMNEKADAVLGAAVMMCLYPPYVSLPL